MARKKQTESASQPLTHWFSSQRTAPSSNPAAATPGYGARAGVAPETESARKRQSGKARALGPSVSFASTLTPLSSPPSSPVRRSDRIRASATPVPPRRPALQLQSVGRMPAGIRCPSPLELSPPKRPRRTSPPRFMKSVPDAFDSDIEEIPSSQKDDDEPIPDDDIVMLESLPVFHHSSPPTSPSSEGLITPAPATPPRLPSPDSKARHIIDEIRAKARLAAVSASPPSAKRPLSPTSDDSDDLPDAGFLMSPRAPLAKRRTSKTPSPTQLRRSGRRSGPPPRPATRLTAPPKPKPQRNPFASLVREHAARAKRSDSLPLAPDGSRQNLLAIADAALLRNVDASFDEETEAEASQLVDADMALDQLVEGGFAAEAEMVRRAGAAPVESGWTMFGPGTFTTPDVLAVFPATVIDSMHTPYQCKVWGQISSWVSSSDYHALSDFLGSSMLQLALVNVSEPAVLEPVTRWLVELVFLTSERLSLAENAAREFCSLAGSLSSDAQGRMANHIAQCLLRMGPPGEGVQIARQVLGVSDETAYIASSKKHRSLLTRLCSSMLDSLTGSKNIFPLIIVLFLIGIDSALGSHSSIQISNSAEDWICRAKGFQEQLQVCQILARALSGLPVRQKRDCIRRVLRGKCPATGHMAMWLATAFLDDKGMDDVTITKYSERPPLDRVLDYIEGMHITASTDYLDLLATIQLLDTALLDVAALVETERRAGRVIKYQAGVQPDSAVNEAIHMLKEMHGRIVDSRATDMEKTKTKAALQTLYIRLGWDVMEAARRGQKPAKTIRDMWGNTKSTRPVPKQL